MAARIPPRACIFLLFGSCLYPALALNPRTPIRQYSRTTWTQREGLPQDTIRAITQTLDGYLWLGTDEGLARFDGYEFVIYKTPAGLPSDSITALAAGKDGSLWIGTPNGLSQWKGGRFVTFSERNGLANNSVRSLFVDHLGSVWVAAGGNLSRFDGKQFNNYLRSSALPMRVVRQVAETSTGVVYAAGNLAVAKLDQGTFRVAFPIVSALETPIAISIDRENRVWVVSSHGLQQQDPSGEVHRIHSPSMELQTVINDRDGNVWVGTNAGIARVEGDRIEGSREADSQDPGLVLCLFEDRDGNLWAGGGNGLTRFRDNTFATYGRSEGLPSDEPNALLQDRQGRIWAGFLDHGVVVWPPGKPEAAERIVPEGKIYSIREAPTGEILIAGREGFMRVNGRQVRTVPIPDALGRRRVFDALEDSSGRVWLAMPAGLGELYQGRFRIVIPAGQLLQEDSFIRLEVGRDGSLWAGTIRRGLWNYKDGQARLYGAKDGLPSEEIRTLYQTRDGPLWIGTFGGGLSRFENGTFVNYGTKQGMLSDNITQIADAGASLWFGTTRGISRVFKQDLADFKEHRISTLRPQNFGYADGLASVQSSPDTGSTAIRSEDGSLWFATARGIVVFDPKRTARPPLPPAVRFLELSADDRRFGADSPIEVPAGSGRVQIRYSAIHLGAPEQVDYSYKLEGLDSDWVRADNRHFANYNSLGPGRYRFLVRADLPKATPAPARDEASLEFDILPHVYETNWFRAVVGMALAALLWFGYQYKQRQVRLRYAAVLEERARLAREVHDTLAQGFVGVASQLDAAEMFLPQDPATARDYLEIARRMTRHSLTEARRSVQDLRASALDDHDLAQALEAAVKQWTKGSPLTAQVTVQGDTSGLPGSTAHQLLRIAQEAVANAIKHADARSLHLEVRVEEGKLQLRIADDGRGFEPAEALQASQGHFGLIGMRERAKRIEGTIEVHSGPQGGTRVEVTVRMATSQ